MAIKIRANSFRQWMLANFTVQELRELAQHGADTGWQGMTYTSDAAKLFDRFGDEIWDMATDAADGMGHDNVAEMLATFHRSDMLCSLSGFKNLMVWYAAESIANDITA